MSTYIPEIQWITLYTSFSIFLPLSVAFTLSLALSISLPLARRQCCQMALLEANWEVFGPKGLQSAGNTGRDGGPTE